MTKIFVQKLWKMRKNSEKCEKLLISFSFLKNSQVQINSKLNEKNRMITYTNFTLQMNCSLKHGKSSLRCMQFWTLFLRFLPQCCNNSLNRKVFLLSPILICYSLLLASHHLTVCELALSFIFSWFNFSGKSFEKRTRKGHTIT